MAHIRTIIPERSNDRARVYKCARCQAGPVTVQGNILRIGSMKNGIAVSAAASGVPNDCAGELVRKVMES